MINEFEFGNFDLVFHLAWSLPLVFLACAWGVARRRQVLERFGIDMSRYRDWVRAGAQRRWLRTTVMILCLGSLGVAAMRPRCNPEKTTFRQQARDVAVLVDVSRSMLAEDLRPNRLERAKLELDRLCDRLKGDRIGLIAFAGDAVIQCPLTSNYSYFKSSLRGLSPRSASQGGSKIGDAVRKALSDLLGVDTKVRSSEEKETKAGETVLDAELRDERQRAFADILMITDGEDHDSYPLRAAEQAAEANVGIYVVGLGDEAGTPIPIRNESGQVSYLKYKGDVVQTKLDATMLQEMILKAPRGSFTRAGTQNFDLVEIFEQTIGKEEGREVLEENVAWTEIFQVFVLAGFACYLIYLSIPERPSRRAAEITEAQWT
ncbi:MAG: VWA domain-containing protein [Planctomycetota bacterium]